AQIGGAIEQRGSTLLADASAHHLVPDPVFSPHAVVAKGGHLQTGGWSGDDRILWILVPGQEVVGAGGDAGVLAAGVVAAVHDGGDSVVVDQAAGPAAPFVRAARGWRQRDGEVAPGDQVLTGGVAPVDVGVVRASGVVLVEQVVGSAPLAE